MKITLLICLFAALIACDKEPPTGSSPVPVDSTKYALISFNIPAQYGNEVFAFQDSLSVPFDSTLVGCGDNLKVILDSTYTFRYRDSLGAFQNLFGVSGGMNTFFTFYASNGGVPVENVTQGDTYYQQGLMAAYVVTDSTQKCLSSDFTLWKW